MKPTSENFAKKITNNILERAKEFQNATTETAKKNL